VSPGARRADLGEGQNPARDYKRTEHPAGLDARAKGTLLNRDANALIAVPSQPLALTTTITTAYPRFPRFRANSMDPVMWGASAASTADAPP
jgi:hypothetical protein